MMACGAYYTASETLARPGHRAHFQLSTINYQLLIVILLIVSCLSGADDDVAGVLFGEEVLLGAVQLA